MKSRQTPYTCHLFVCTNVRDNPDTPGCGTKGGNELKFLLKTAIRERGLSETVRVSSSGCMGLCTTGPNILLYPQGIHFSEVTPADLKTILDSIQP